MKILKKGGNREKGGGGNEIHAPCACGAHQKLGYILRRKLDNTLQPYSRQNMYDIVSNDFDKLQVTASVV